MKAATREEAAKWVEVLKVLQAMEVDDSNGGGGNGSGNGNGESPSASMVQGAEGSRGLSGASHWSKDNKCFGLLSMCACWRES
jgi:hypothetical protein